MPDAGGVKYIDWPQQTPKTGRLREQVALDVIDNHAVVPSEELADSEQSLAASRRGDNQEVAEFRALPGLPDRHQASTEQNAPGAEEHAVKRKRCRQERPDLIYVSKPRP